jgi:hypothetical protein
MKRQKATEGLITLNRHPTHVSVYLSPVIHYNYTAYLLFLRNEMHPFASKKKHICQPSIRSQLPFILRSKVHSICYGFHIMQREFSGLFISEET